MEDWDPMLEDFTAGNRYKEGPGAGLEFTTECDSLDNGQQKYIYIKNLPKGINTQGIKNLCLSSGIPVDIYISNDYNFAIVKFSKKKEAELAVRDLHNEPPYNLKVFFAKPLNQKDKAQTDFDKGLDSQKTSDINEKSKYKIFCASSAIHKSNMNEKENNEEFPYFQINSEYKNASLIMRQKYLDFKTELSCISMGRGYFHLRDMERFRSKNIICKFRSDDWNLNSSNVLNCYNCGALTFRNNRRSIKTYCSEECQKKTCFEKNTSNILQNIQLKHAYDSVFDFFTVGKSGTIEVLQEEIKTTLGSARVPCCVILEDKCLDYKRLNEFSYHSKEAIRAEKDDIIMACDENGKFLRGIVLDLQNDFYQIALIDYGKIITVKHVYALPEDLKNIIRFSGLATFVGGSSFNFSEIKFRLKRRKLFDTWFCDVLMNNIVVGEIILEKWSQPQDLIYVPFESGCAVVISFYCEMKSVFVRRIDKPWNEEFIKFSNDIAEYSLEAKTYDELPECGEICGARFKLDGCYYRAIVRSVKNETITVFFMDYGNEQEANLKDLIYLPCTAKQINCFAKRVTLKDVTEISSPQSVTYLNNLTAYETELVLTYENDNKGDIILTEKSSGDVNKILADTSTPIWKKDTSAFLKIGDIFFLESVKELSFNVGKTVDIFILNFDISEFNSNSIFWATRNINEYLVHLNTELKKMITDYCSFLMDDCYLPRIGELCLAKFEGKWYRGVALDDENTICKIFLIDFGITVSLETKSIRKILKEFLEMPALAIKCKVPGIENLDKNQQQKIVDYLQSKDKNHINDVKILEERDNAYIISIPFIEEVLNNTRSEV